MEPIRIEVERIDPAEALRRIRADIDDRLVEIEARIRKGAYDDFDLGAEAALEDALRDIDEHWPNGAQP